MQAYSSVYPVKNTAVLLSCTVTPPEEVTIAQKR